MNKLRRIHKGDTLGLIVASTVINDFNNLTNFIKLLNDHGYKVKEGISLRSKDGYLSGSDALRANDLMAMFKDDDIAGILCYKGGYGAQRLLPYLDFEEIKKHPKLLMGFSDVTVLLNTLNKYADMPTVHGEMGVCLSTYDDFTINDFFRVLDTGPIGTLKNPKDDAVELVPGIAEGKLVGGNLSLVYALMGTKYEIEFEDNILFIEDVDERPYSIDRMLSSLVLSEKIQKCKGIICGYFTRCKSDVDQQVEDLLEHYLKPLGIPVLTNFASGHDKPFVNLPIGLIIRLNTHDKSVTALESLYLEK